MKARRYKSNPGGNRTLAKGDEGRSLDSLLATNILTPQGLADQRMKLVQIVAGLRSSKRVASPGNLDVDTASLTRLDQTKPARRVG